ncbi:MAG TPA: exodeoxyribonuclease VII small subunit [Longimicrobiaceae bacterium]|nr:exodeoxyribonuclease VII small subunit [Longimicrobiaceae bacterium]
MTKQTSTETAVSLEDVLVRLDGIARRIEDDDVELSESLALFEEGVGLLRSAHEILGRAAERVQQLVEDADGFRLERLDDR